MSLRAMYTASLSLFLAACGGGGGDTSDKMVTSAEGSIPFERAIMLEVEERPLVPVPVGNHFEVKVSIRCTGAANGGCPRETVQVKEIYPAFGTVVQILHYEGGQVVQSYTGAQRQGYMEPTAPIQLSREGSLVFIIHTGPADVTTGKDPRQWSFATDQATGLGKVSGSQPVVVMSTWPRTVL